MRMKEYTNTLKTVLCTCKKKRKCSFVFLQCFKSLDLFVSCLTCFMFADAL